MNRRTIASRITSGRSGEEGGRVKLEAARSSRATSASEMTLIAPPSALLPYIKVAGPRSTSMRSAEKGSMLTAWSGLVSETSPESTPSSRMRMRLPPCPRLPCGSSGLPWPPACGMSCG